MPVSTIQRTHTSFRIDTSLLATLRGRAAASNRTLNNYVETLLKAAVTMPQATDDIPNEETIAAMKEAAEYRRTGGGEVYESVDELMAALAR